MFLRRFLQVLLAVLSIVLVFGLIGSFSFSWSFWSFIHLGYLGIPQLPLLHFYRERGLLAFLQIQLLRVLSFLQTLRILHELQKVLHLFTIAHVQNILLWLLMMILVLGILVPGKICRRRLVQGSVLQRHVHARSWIVYVFNSAHLLRLDQKWIKFYLWLN